MKPCPFCGSHNIDPEGWASLDPETRARRTGPTCDDCMASADSVEAWNRRAGDDSLDARRWQALMRCGRIKMQGSSGVDPHTGKRNGNNVHFGAEFWPERHDKFPDLIEGHDKSTAWGVACLAALADAIIEQEQADD